MKSVLLSIKPKYCELIASGKKTVEIRKNRPKIDVPFKVYMYQTKGRWIYKILEWLGLYQRKVIGEFVCDNIECFDVPYPAFQNELEKRFIEQSCMSYYDLHRYAYHDVLYAWHISDLIIYDKPKELSEFYHSCNPSVNDGSCYGCRYAVGLSHETGGVICENVLTRPPQSWCYVEGLEDLK